MVLCRNSCITVHSLTCFEFCFSSVSMSPRLDDKTDIRRRLAWHQPSSPNLCLSSIFRGKTHWLPHRGWKMDGGGGCEIRFVTLRIWAQGVYKDRQWIDTISEALGYICSAWLLPRKELFRGSMNVVNMLRNFLIRGSCLRLKKSSRNSQEAFYT